jgi:Mn-dependent DtxR family transcriptional regulator
MTLRIPIRSLLALRTDHADQQVLDYLELASVVRDHGLVSTNLLQRRWGVHQCNVSRRMSRLAADGLADITPSHGSYLVHGLRSLEVAS